MLCKTKLDDFYARYHIPIRWVYIIVSNMQCLLSFYNNLPCIFIINKKLCESSQSCKWRYFRLKTMMFRSLCCECQHGTHVHEESTRMYDAIFPKYSWSHKACYKGWVMSWHKKNNPCMFHKLQYATSWSFTFKGQRFVAAM